MNRLPSRELTVTVATILTVARRSRIPWERAPPALVALRPWG